jgi:hypothetical protein
LSPNDIVKIDDVMAVHYPNSRVKFEEARELSWRRFYNEAGGRENIIAIEGSSIVGKLLKKCEKLFLDILENKLSDEEITALIKLPSTETWVEDYDDVPISLKEKVTDEVISEKDIYIVVVKPIKSINCKIIIKSEKNTGNDKKSSGDGN